MADVKVKFTADTTGVQKGAARVSDSISKVKAMAASVAAPMLALGGILGGLAIGGIGKGLKDLIDYSGTIDDLTNITDMSAKNLVIFQKALEDAGIEAATTTKILSGLSNAIEDPSPKTLEWLDKFNLKISDLQKLSPVDRFAAIAKGIGGLSTQAQKLKASTDFFSKLGPSLVTLFKTPDAIGDATQYVGSLAGNMDKLTSKLAPLGDSLDGLKYKWLQFFAGMAAPNVDAFTKLKAAVDGVDLGPLGEKLGNVVNVFTEAFKQGKLWSTLWDGFSAVIRKAGELLISVFELAAQRFSRVLEDTLRGTKLGRTIGIEDDKVTPINLPNGQVAHSVVRQYSTPNEKFSDILERNKNLLGGADAAKKFSALLKPPAETSTTRDPIKEADSIFQEIFDFKDSVKAAMFGDSADVVMTKGVTQVQEHARAEPFKPILSSLAKIGGASAFTRNPLISIQKRANQLLETIAANTAKTTIAPSAWS